ncbi:polyphosphate kinase 1 [uncultured Abyssibacter sp.]|uniref:polyphosphate kinase 1 n=1 Tax=uncultured Abyssibacter sp. TaxID=2320202 RepID=UPI0032B2CB09
MNDIANNGTDTFTPDRYINRWLSLLEFNQRVLEQAKDERVPLIERMKFLCISCSNLDEFYEVRVAGLKQMAEVGAVQAGPDNILPTTLLSQISERAHALVADQYGTLNSVLIPALEQENIRFVRRVDWVSNAAQDDWLRNYFHNELLPVLSPIGLDPAHPFPRIINKSLNFVVSLDGKDAFGRTARFAVVGAPRSLPRLIQIPPDVEGAGPNDFVFLSSVIHAYVDELFPGMTVSGCYQFRVTRNSELFVDEEEVDDLLLALEGELPQRQYGDEVRLEVAHNCPDGVWQYLLDKLGLTEEDLFRVDGPVNLNRLMALGDMVDRPDLKYPPFTSRLSTSMGQDRIFDTISRKDILLHHPFDSFAPVVEFLRAAAKDPDVLAIKQTLYRTGTDSAVVDALIKAAHAGKEVTVVVELRARFDEADNIGLAEALQEAGAHVVYGVVGHKAHAKMVLIVRREKGRLTHYCHLSTGNYHPRTARLYTDYGLFTADPAIGEDVHRVFLQLTSLGKVLKLDKLLQSPFSLHPGIMAFIARETEHARTGRGGRIIAKMNSLTERSVIDALYEASQAGVEIDLIIRGMCCLRPGVPGLSDHIRVRSIIGRFLEHTRVYYFANNGKPDLYCASADWMERNLFRRVETAFPILDKKLAKRVLAELDLYLRDNSQSWELTPEGTYQRDVAGDDLVSAQQVLMEG